MLFLWAGQPATGLIGFVGDRVDNEMHLDLQQMGPDGMVILVRIRFFDITAVSYTHLRAHETGSGSSYAVFCV